MRKPYDLAIVGSGFGGAILAMIARRLGKSVLLLEKGQHPRFAIGESTTPLTNLMLEELSASYGLHRLSALSKWGTWQRSYPHLGCGLKRGFTFYHHRLGDLRAANPTRREQLLVAASPNNEISDTHWYRPDVDSFLVEEAKAAGAIYFDQVQLSSATEQETSMTLAGTRFGERVEYSAALVIDASGPRGFLHRALGLPEVELPGFPKTEALYTHFRNVDRMEDVFRTLDGPAPPYPVDDAALHHVFDGGWIWILRFNNGITSAGAAVTPDLAAHLRLSEGEPAWHRLLNLLPAVRQQFQKATAERPFTYAARPAFRSGVMAGKRWALLPSAAGFVDPLMSTGFPLVLFGVSRLAKLLERQLTPDDLELSLQTYAEQTDEDLLATAKLIGALYAGMNNFPLFVSLSMLYFTAAIYSEAARRLGRPHLAGAFLMRDHPTFGPQSTALLARASRTLGAEETAALRRDILNAIEPFDLAGLGREERGNWYPVEAEDFLAAAGKVGANRQEVLALLVKCGFSG